MATEQAHVRVGVGVFVVRDGKILTGLRAGKVPGAGQWALPGGHLEMYESFEECAAREAKEETGLDVSECSVVAIENVISEKDRYHYVVAFVRAEAADGQEAVNREPHKCEGWHWKSLSELRTLEPMFSSLRQVLDNGCDPTKGSAAR
ncbi:unnamed protein product [Pedinophyceae sp. YPF-701]|nr:unnamed protein product [Pedinophyceae sp. YPF-701]